MSSIASVANAAAELAGNFRGQLLKPDGSRATRKQERSTTAWWTSARH